jgi:hypothetical protein
MGVLGATDQGWGWEGGRSESLFPFLLWDFQIPVYLRVVEFPVSRATYFSAYGVERETQFLFLTEPPLPPGHKKYEGVFLIPSEDLKCCAVA